MKFAIYWDSYCIDIDVPSGYAKIGDLQAVILDILNLAPARVMYMIHDRGILGIDITFDRNLNLLEYSPSIWLIIDHYPSQTINIVGTRLIFKEWVNKELGNILILPAHRNLLYRLFNSSNSTININQNNNTVNAANNNTSNNNTVTVVSNDTITNSANNSANNMINNNALQSNIPLQSNQIISINDVLNLFYHGSTHNNNNQTNPINSAQNTTADTIDNQLDQIESMLMDYINEYETTNNTNADAIYSVTLDNGNTLYGYTATIPLAGSNTSNNISNTISNNASNAVSPLLSMIMNLATLDGSDLESFFDLIAEYNLEDVNVTLDANSINKLPLVKFNTLKDYDLQTDIHDKCAICLEQFIDDDDVRLLTCKHFFHKNCIDTWLTEHNVHCPLCRNDTRENENIDNANDKTIKNDNENEDDNDESEESEDVYDNVVEEFLAEEIVDDIDDSIMYIIDSVTSDLLLSYDPSTDEEPPNITDVEIMQTFKEKLMEKIGELLHEHVDYKRHYITYDDFKDDLYDRVETLISPLLDENIKISQQIVTTYNSNEAQNNENDNNTIQAPNRSNFESSVINVYENIIDEAIKPYMNNNTKK